MKRVVIIGGGITGLAAAHRLVERSKDSGQRLDLTLLEANDQPGGVIQTEHRDGFLLERGPDSFISEKPEAVALAKSIGLESHLIETNSQYRRSFIVRKGRLRPVPQGFQLLAPARLWPFITTDIFSWAGKARMAMDLLLPKGNINGNADETLASFVRRRLGREALTRMAQPMVGGIYTADPEKLSLRATMPRFLEMERDSRSVILAMWKSARRLAREETRGTSGARYGLFLSFDRGMQVLVDQLAAKLPQGSLKLRSRATRLLFDESQVRWTVELESGDFINADIVCLALPAYRTGALLRSADPTLASELEGIPYESTATLNLAYRRAEIPHRLDGFGFVVPFIEKRSLIACTFSSVKFPGRAPEGNVLLRAFVGGALQAEMFALDEEEMALRVRSDLRDLLGIEAAPLFIEVAKWVKSMPQYHVGHLARVKRIQERVMPLKNLVLAGNAYVGPGIPDCIRSGTIAAEKILTL
jgi:oxygen-dependent protoporphyrinogen oxidase